MTSRSMKAPRRLGTPLPPALALQRALSPSIGVLAASGGRVHFPSGHADYFAPARCLVDGRPSNTDASALLPWARTCAGAVRPFEIVVLQFQTSDKVHCDDHVSAASDNGAFEAVVRFLLAAGLRAARHFGAPAGARAHVTTDLLGRPTTIVSAATAVSAGLDIIDVADLQEVLRRDAKDWLKGLTILEIDGDFTVPSGHQAAALARWVFDARPSATRPTTRAAR